MLTDNNIAPDFRLTLPADKRSYYDAAGNKLVKAFPELSCRYLKWGEEVELAAWYIIQSEMSRLNYAETLRMDQCIVLLKEAGWTESSISKVLHKSDGVLWKIETQKNMTRHVRPKSRKQVFRFLAELHTGAITSISEPVSIKVKDLKLGKKLRAWIFASSLGMFKGKPVSRETVTNLTSVSESCQRRYEKITGIIVEENWQTPTDEDKKDEDFQPRLGNSYTYPSATVPHKLLREQRRIVWVVYCKGHDLIHTAKRFFDSAMEYIKYKKAKNKKSLLRTLYFPPMRSAYSGLHIKGRFQWSAV